MSPTQSQQPRRRFRAFVSILAALILGSFAALATSGEATAAGSAGVRVGEPAPDFTLKSSEGGTYTLGDRAGKKNVVLVFFRGTW